MSRTKNENPFANACKEYHWFLQQKPATTRVEHNHTLLVGAVPVGVMVGGGNSYHDSYQEYHAELERHRLACEEERYIDRNHHYAK